MDIEVRHLKLISTVAEEGNLTKAGERLHLTQSALSHQLHSIEETLGATVFSRVSKKMILTPAGESLLRSAQIVNNELDRVSAEIRRLINGQGGVLRLTTECYTTYHWLPAILKTFQQEFPSVEVQIVLEATRMPLKALKTGKIDVALVTQPIDSDSGIHFDPLFKDELVVVMSSAHPLAKKPFIQAKDFADQNLMLYDVPIEDSTIIQEVLNPAKVSPGRISRVQLTEAKIEFAKANWGIAVLARWAVAPHLDCGQLVARPLTKKGFFRQWYAATIKNDLTPNYIAEFISLITAQGLAPSDLNGLSAMKSKNNVRKSTGFKLAAAKRNGHAINL